MKNQTTNYDNGTGYSRLKNIALSGLAALSTIGLIGCDNDFNINLRLGVIGEPVIEKKGQVDSRYFELATMQKDGEGNMVPYMGDSLDSRFYKYRRQDNPFSGEVSTSIERVNPYSDGLNTLVFVDDNDPDNNLDQVRIKHTPIVRGGEYNLPQSLGVVSGEPNEIVYTLDDNGVWTKTTSGPDSSNSAGVEEEPPIKKPDLVWSKLWGRVRQGILNSDFDPGSTMESDVRSNTNQWGR